MSDPWAFEKPSQAYASGEAQLGSSRRACQHGGMKNLTAREANGPHRSSDKETFWRGQSTRAFGRAHGLSRSPSMTQTNGAYAARPSDNLVKFTRSAHWLSRATVLQKVPMIPNEPVPRQ